jgi:hypothetical protein
MIKINNKRHKPHKIKEEEEELFNLKKENGWRFFHCNHINTNAMKKLEKKFQHLHKKTPYQTPIK